MLIETLLSTEQRLRELTLGEVDSVATRDGRTFLLRHAQEQLRDSEAGKQVAILNALPARIALVNAQGVIISVNEAWRRFADANVLHGPKHGIGLNYLEICDQARGDGSAEARRVAEGIRSVLSNREKSFSLEYPCNSATEQRWFLLTVTPLLDNRPNGAVVMHLDITERRCAEETAKRLQKVEEEQRLAVETARVKNDFLATMSHELRTPLNAVIGFAGTLLMELPGPITVAQKKQLETIKSSAHHQLSLINDLLDLAKIESGKVKLRLEPVACDEIVRAVAEILRPIAESKGLAFHVDLPAETRVARAETRALKQILINLVNNAIKFTEHGEVRIELSDCNEKTRIAITDTGTGISEDDRPKLFKAFSRLERTGAKPEEGAGLGLHLSQKLAHLMGGEITQAGESGTGSTFTLLLDTESPAQQEDT